MPYNGSDERQTQTCFWFLDRHVIVLPYKHVSLLESKAPGFESDHLHDSCVWNGFGMFAVLVKVLATSKVLEWFSP